jgi:hypothetical protein
LAIPLHLGKFVRALKHVLLEISLEEDWVIACVRIPEVRSQCEIAFIFLSVPVGKGN